MRNVWVICRKELNSYFVSWIAYLLLAMFAVVFGFFFWVILNSFVYQGIEMQMRGQAFPMNINEQIVRPLFGNVTVIALLVIIPLITMRLFAEEKRTGTIRTPGHITNPRPRNHYRQVASRAAALRFPAAVSGTQLRFPLHVRQA